MGFLKNTSSTRCRYAACFALGFVVASLILAAMFWIIWCYLGLSIVQISDTQRRAIVEYSYTTSRPSTTSSPNNRTEVDGALESSLNAISKSPVTPPTQSRRRTGDSSADLAKGDFAARPSASATQNSTRREPIMPSLTSSTHERKASILTEREEGILHRKISTSNTENRAHELGLPDIKPTQTYAPAQSDPLPTAPRDERRPLSRDSDAKGEIQAPRDSYRDPDFEREPPARRSEPGRRRYDEDDDYDYRGSPSRYDKRDRGRHTDDRYSKGDTRVYPEERPRQDDGYPPRDSGRRRGDDRDSEDRYREKDDRYRDYDERYKDRDDTYRYRDDISRDGDKYRNDKPYAGDDINRRRDNRKDYDDRYRPRDDRDRYDGRYGPREDRYPDNGDRNRDRTYDDKRDRYHPRDDEDKYPRPRDRDYKDPVLSSRVDISSEKKNGRPDVSRRPSDDDGLIRDRPRTSPIDESRKDDRYLDQDDEYRTSKYVDRDRVSPTKTNYEPYISRSTDPVYRSRDDTYKLGSSVLDERKRYDNRDRDRDRPKYAYDDTIYISPSSVRETDSSRREASRDVYRTILPDRKSDDALERRLYSTEEEENYRRQNSRTKYHDDADRKSPGDSRRDYTTDEDYRGTRTDDDEEYRRSRPRGDYERDKSRDSGRRDRPIDDDDRPSRRYSTEHDDRPSRRYSTEHDDRPSRRYSPEYDEPRRRSDADIGLRKESRDVVDDDRTSLPRPEVRQPMPPSKDRRYDDDIPSRPPTSDDRPFRSRPDTIDDRPLRPADERTSKDGRSNRDKTYPDDGRRYKDEVSSNPDDSSRDIPPRSERRDIFVGSQTSPRDVVVRETTHHTSDYDKEEERTRNVKDVIETALKRSDAHNPNPKEVPYPAYDPKVSNLTVTDYIPPGFRRGNPIMSRRRRSRT